MTPLEWMHQEMGVSEISGAGKNNPRIIWYDSFTSLKATTDETPWCSACLCAAAESTGFLSTKSAAAISWKDYGEDGDGSAGDIVVFAFPTGGHHVALLDKKYSIGDHVAICCGGNQNNKVCTEAFLAKNIIAIRKFIPKVL